MHNCIPSRNAGQRDPCPKVPYSVWQVWQAECSCVWWHGVVSGGAGCAAGCSRTGGRRREVRAWQSGARSYSGLLWWLQPHRWMTMGCAHAMCQWHSALLLACCCNTERLLSAYPVLHIPAAAPAAPTTHCAQRHASCWLLFNAEHLLDVLTACHVLHAICRTLGAYLQRRQCAAYSALLYAGCRAAPGTAAGTAA